MTSNVFEVDEKIVPPIYRPYLFDETRYLVLYGGRGSAKTSFACRKYVLRCFKNEYFQCAYVRKAAAHIRDSLYSELKKAIIDLSLQEYFRCYDGDYRIVCTNGNQFLPRGVDDPDLTKGLAEISHLLIEEVNQLTQDDFTTLDELLRTAKTKVQTIVLFNPVMETHWLRKYFFHPQDKHAPNPVFGDDLKVIRTTLRNNNYIHRDKYEADLRRNAMGNTNKIRVNIDGDWGMEQNDDPWLYTYDDDKYVKKLTFYPTFPVYLSFDFNKDPMSCTAWQMSPMLGSPHSFIHCIAEFTGVQGLENLCKKIKGRFSNSIIFVTGDANGNSKYHAHVLQYNSSDDSTYEGKNDTNYRIIQRTMGLHENQMHTFSKNMEHSDSRQLCNIVFHHHPNVFIDESCETLRNECQLATVDEKSLKASQLKKDRENYKMDIFDSMRYFMQRYCKKYSDTFLMKPNS